MANPRQATVYQLPSTKYLKQPPGYDNNIVGCIKNFKLSRKLSLILPGTKRGLKSVSHWESHTENLSRSCWYHIAVIVASFRLVHGCVVCKETNLKYQFVRKVIHVDEEKGVQKGTH